MHRGANLLHDIVSFEDNCKRESGKCKGLCSLPSIPGTELAPPSSPETTARHGKTRLGLNAHSVPRDPPYPALRLGTMFVNSPPSFLGTNEHRGRR